MNLLKAVVLCLALLLAAEAAADVQVAKLSTSKGSFRSDNDADTSKSSEERALPFGLSSAFEKVHSFRASFRKWYRDYTATAFFEKWKLGDNVSDLLNNPLFFIWILYVGDKDPMDRHWWVRILMEKTETYTLSDAVTNAMQSMNADIRELATKLQLRRLEIWTEEGVRIIEMLENLQLNGNIFFKHPAFQQLYKYCKKQPNYHRAFFVALLQHYTQTQVIKVLVDGQNNPSTSGLATELYEDLLTYYRNIGYTSADLLERLFGYDRPTIQIDFSSPKYHLWKDFALKGSNEPELKKLLEDLKMMSDEPHILYFILMLKKRPECADLARQMEKLFVTELTQRSEKEYEKTIRWQRYVAFDNYRHVITNKRKEYLESLRASTSENQ